MELELTQVHAIFTAAVALPPAERSDYLDRTCGNDLGLREYVQALLSSHEKTDTFLGAWHGAAASAVDEASSVPLVERNGSVIGRYKLTDQIGEGGMGVVFLAEQTSPVRRKVALKIIKLGMDTRQVVARFEAERQALAMMEHPSIAKVLDAGSTDAGRPYFVMELVDGAPITTYCDQRRLGLSERLHLFIQVCNAVQHAHQKGIIHRDLKPSNVMVAVEDGKPIPKVIDFGVAKATQGRLTDVTVVTELRQMIGTPAYMSPEQAELGRMDIDTRSDVYSLGVLLYELLTGRTPFDPRDLMNLSFVEMQQQVRDVDPPRPSARLLALPADALLSVCSQRRSNPKQLGQALKSDLDWVIMKCLEKDRSARYETAAELAQDIHRFLADEPLAASRPSSLYRLQKFTKKHRHALRLGAAFILVLVVATVISIWQAVRATHAETRAVINMVDLYTSRGLDMTPTVNAFSPLWFAQAATVAGADPLRVEANLIRVNNWLSDAWIPVAALQNKIPADQLSFNPKNNRYLLTSPPCGPVTRPCRIWDLATEAAIALPGDFKDATAAAWIPDGRVVLGNARGMLAVASVGDGRIEQLSDARRRIERIAVSADGKMLAAASGNAIFVAAMDGSAESSFIEFSASVSYLNFAPAGDQVVATSTDDHAHLISIARNSQARLILREALAPIRHISQTAGPAQLVVPPFFMDHGRALATIDQPGSAGSSPGILKYWDTATAKQLAQADVQFAIWAMSASPDGSQLAATAGAGHLYDVSGRQGARIPAGVASAFHPRRPLISIADQLGVIRTYQIDAKGEIREMGSPIKSPEVRLISFSEDGNLLAILTAVGDVRVWRMPADAPTAPPGLRMNYDGNGSCAAFSPDGRFVAPISSTEGEPGVRSIQVFDIQQARPTGHRLTLDAMLESAAFSPNNQLIAAASGGEHLPHRFRIWDWQSGNLCCSRDLPSEPACIAYAPDGKAVAVICFSGQFFLIDVADGHVIHQGSAGGLITPPLRSISFSRDGKTFFTYGVEVFQAWDRATGTERFAIIQKARCTGVSESPDGRTLATCNNAGELSFFDPATGHALRPPIEHPHVINTFMFTPDGNFIATACRDSQVRIWDVRTGALVRAMAVPGNLSAAAFIGDGRWVITTCYHSDANYGPDSQIWDAHTGFPLGPPFLATGGYHQRINISPNGRWAAIGGSPEYAVLIDLPTLISTGGRTADDALLWCELLSSTRVDGSETVHLTGAEWLDRWRQYRTRHPEFRPIEN